MSLNLIDIESFRTRIERKSTNSKGEFIAYWMSNAQRVDCNYTLERALKFAHKERLPLKIFFIYNPGHYKTLERHHCFMLHGLLEVNDLLKKYNHSFHFFSYKDNLLKEILDRCNHLFIDLPYTERARAHLKKELIGLDMNIYSVDNLYLPLTLISKKQEFSAATLRKKYYKILDNTLIGQDFSVLEYISKVDSFIKNTDSRNQICSEIDKLNIDNLIDKNYLIRSGPITAQNVIDDFLDNSLDNYQENSNNPEFIKNSTISRYLHYGHISSAKIITKLIENNLKIDHPFIEQLLIRRELAYNFTYYNKNYNNSESLPNWAIKTLNEHNYDKREYLYTLKDFEFAKTHDVYWNSAQHQLLTSGYIHGYMRMYWGKKILEWTSNYKEAIKIALYLNNKYQLDGRNPNSYVGILWCFGLHDRAWKERKVFGKIRYMNENGLRRKFDINRYVEKVSKNNLF